MSHSRSYVVGFSLPNLCCPTRLSIFVVPHLNNKVIMIKKEKEKGKQSNSHRIAIIPGDHKLFSTLRVSSGGLQSPVSISFVILIRNSFVRSFVRYSINQSIALAAAMLLPLLTGPFGSSSLFSI